jgi:integrase
MDRHALRAIVNGAVHADSALVSADQLMAASRYDHPLSAGLPVQGGPAQARQKTLTAAQQNSPLAARPYDLRHSGITLALNAGIPAPEVARRAGHSVPVLLRVYAGCLDGHEQLWNSRLDQALNEQIEL